MNQLTGLMQLIQGLQTLLHRQMHYVYLCFGRHNARDIVAKLMDEKADTIGKHSSFTCDSC